MILAALEVNQIIKMPSFNTPACTHTHTNTHSHTHTHSSHFGRTVHTPLML